jgi:hypothetical protein
MSVEGPWKQHCFPKKEQLSTKLFVVSLASEENTSNVKNTQKIKYMQTSLQKLDSVLGSHGYKY